MPTATREPPARSRRTDRRPGGRGTSKGVEHALFICTQPTATTLVTDHWAGGAALFEPDRHHKRHPRPRWRRSRHAGGVCDELVRRGLLFGGGLAFPGIVALMRLGLCRRRALRLPFTGVGRSRRVQ